MNPGLLTTYREWLPISEQTPPLTLHEGNTPLLRAERLATWVGVRELYLKFDGLNPSGSFKDRRSAVLANALRKSGVREVVEDSSGNAGASSATTIASPAGVLHA